jgi:hypothetical protein
VPLRKDIWRPAIVDRPLGEIVAAGGIGDAPVHWLPEQRPYAFLADPFGLWRGGLLHLFVEHFDYRDRHGRIELLIYDRRYTLLDRRPVLIEPWHLSYPFVFEAEGETWMLPEAHRSGRLTLYRAADFPWRWEAVAVIALDCVAVDATPFWHDGLWWLFYTSATDRHSKIAELRIAWTEELTGAWHPHRLNPVRNDPVSARPGGTPVLIDGKIRLPVQDCQHTYGGGIAMLAIERLTPEAFSARLERTIARPLSVAGNAEGMHTLSAAGEVTLIDVKRTLLSVRGLAIEVRRELGRLPARLRG